MSSNSSTYLHLLLIQILVGNKCDSNSKIVDRDTAMRYAVEEEMDEVFEVSAKTGDNLPELFAALSKMVSERYPDRLDTEWDEGPTMDDLMTCSEPASVGTPSKKWNKNKCCIIM
jgi:50S ribosomal subunit-associated GTPase HflX